MERCIKIVGTCLIPIAAYNGIAFLAGGCLFLVLSVIGYGNGGRWFFENSSLLITALAGIGAAACFLLPERRKGKCELPYGWKGIVYIIILAAAAVILLNGILNMIPVTGMEMSSYAVDRGSGDMLLTAFTICLAGPAGEEAAFRAFAFGRLRKELGFSQAALWSSLAFGIYHGNLIQGIYAFFLGLMLCWVMENFRTIKGALLGHMAANAVSLALTWTAGNKNWEKETVLFLCLCSGCIIAVIIKAVSKERKKFCCSEKEERL